MGRLDRWARFFEPRALTPLEMLSDALVKELTSELERWPLPVSEWHDPALEARFAPVLTKECPRPGTAVLRAAFQLATWEMEREFEAIDEFYRNDRASELTADPREALALVFLHRWLTDSMLELLEATPRLKRAHLVDVLRRIAIRLGVSVPGGASDPPQSPIVLL
jgi:hypothetical protein